MTPFRTDAALDPGVRAALRCAQGPRLIVVFSPKRKSVIALGCESIGHFRVRNETQLSVGQEQPGLQVARSEKPVLTNVPSLRLAPKCQDACECDHR